MFGLLRPKCKSILFASSWELIPAQPYKKHASWLRRIVQGNPSGQSKPHIDRFLEPRQLYFSYLLLPNLLHYNMAEQSQ